MIREERGLTVARVRELFENRGGVLHWRVRASTHVRVGDVAGTMNRQGQHVIIIAGKQYRRERLVYALERGSFPLHPMKLRKPEPKPPASNSLLSLCEAERGNNLLPHNNRYAHK